MLTGGLGGAGRLAQEGGRCRQSACAARDVLTRLRLLGGRRRSPCRGFDWWQGWAPRGVTDLGYAFVGVSLAGETEMAAVR